MSSDPPTALVVDDDRLSIQSVCDSLESAGFLTTQARDGSQAVEVLTYQEFDLIVTDLRMPGLSGIDLVRHVRAFSKTPVIVLTAYGSVAQCQGALLSGATRFLEFQKDLPKLPGVALELVQRPSDEDVEPKETLREARERKDSELTALLSRLIRRTGGNVSAMAEIMGKDRTTVLYHLKRLGLY